MSTESSCGEKIVMKPGTWNGSKYTEKEIVKGFKDTVWSEACFIFEDFGCNDYTKLVGEVRSVHLNDKNYIVASPHFYTDKAKKAYLSGCFSIAISLLCKHKTKIGVTDIEYTYFGFVTDPCIKD